MSEPTKVQPGEVVRFDQPEWWEQEFDKKFVKSKYHPMFSTIPSFDSEWCVREVKDFIRDLLKEQRLQDSIEPEEV